jgi:hypothetical protein
MLVAYPVVSTAFENHVTVNDHRSIKDAASTQRMPGYTTPSALILRMHDGPRVARALQPWAVIRNRVAVLRLISQRDSRSKPRVGPRYEGLPWESRKQATATPKVFHKQSACPNTQHPKTQSLVRRSNRMKSFLSDAERSGVDLSDSGSLLIVALRSGSKPSLMPPH